MAEPRKGLVHQYVSLVVHDLGSQLLSPFRTFLTYLNTQLSFRTFPGFIYHHVLIYLSISHL